MRTGLVIGKFLPPHAGHKHLIETAQAASDRVLVLVCDSPAYGIPAQLRADWLREIHPAAEVMVIPDIGRDDDSAAWAEHTRWFLAEQGLGGIDAVFTSEDYGDAYARHLGCRHVPVDRARARYGIAGRLIRAAPLRYWDYLEPCVRAHYAVRVCVVGAESTGTTTLATALAAHYRTVWAPEFGRLYSEGKMTGNTPWTSDEFAYIARQQDALEERYLRLCRWLLVCDTNSWATEIWHERYLGAPRQVRGTGRRYDLYLLTAPDIPFEQDGWRDGEHLREWMHGRFQGELEREGWPYLTVSGGRTERLAQAVAACDRLLAAGGAELS